VEEYTNSIGNRTWDVLYRFCGRLPRSARNFYLMEYFKISLMDNEAKRKQAYSQLNLAMKLPKFLNYDQYLGRISYSGKTQIDDIDQFICFTDISDSYFFARLIRANKNVKVYVYSWDHPCKHVKYSRKANYLVWYEGLRQDIIGLQNMPPGQVRVIGSSQFAYVHDFLSAPEAQWVRPFPFDYLYFGCAIGIPALTALEVQTIGDLASMLQKVLPAYKLVVRPYPVLKDWTLYDPVRNLPNVVFDDGFRGKDMAVGEDRLMEKFVKIHFAKAFVHLGTTLGLEACFTRTPSVILDFADFDKGKNIVSLYNFVHQYQNEKYLMTGDFPNVVKSREAFGQLLKLIDGQPETLRAYNRHVVKDIPLKSFGAFTHDLITA
jgi:hypothetical protein